MRYFFIILAVLLVLGLALSTAVAVYLFKMAITRKGVKSGPEEPTEMQLIQRGMIKEAGEWFAAQNPEHVTVTSFDGLKLCARFLPGENAKRTIICAHGFRASAEKDFGPMMKYYHENGANLLMMTQRSHGDSEGDYLCYGVRERFDVQKWAELVNDRLVPEKLPIYLHGVSMGCATVVMASDVELPDNVRGVIADCGFTSAWDQFEYIMKKNFHLPAFPILHIARLICNMTAKFDMKGCNTLEIMSREKYPMLFIHGAKDDFVPTAMSIANHEKCVSKKKLVLFDEAAHALSWTSDLERYKAVVGEFLEECES